VYDSIIAQVTENMLNEVQWGRESWVMSIVTQLGEVDQHVEKALCSHDAVDHLTQEVGMAVVPSIFLDHMHQYPTH
jgi:hypothetical protein